MQAVGDKAVEIGTGERPGHATGIVVRFTATADHEEGAAWGNRVGDPLGGKRPQVRGEHLESVNLQDEPEGGIPRGWPRHEIGDVVPDEGLGKATPAPGDGRRRDVEGIHVEAPAGKRFGVITETAADDEGSLAVATPARPREPVHHMGIGRQIRPWNRRPIPARACVERLEPAEGIVPDQRVGRQGSGPVASPLCRAIALRIGGH